MSSKKTATAATTTKASKRPGASRRGLTILGHPFRGIGVWVGQNHPAVAFEIVDAALRELVAAEGGSYTAAASSLKTYLKDGRNLDKPTKGGWPRFQPSILTKTDAGKVNAAIKRAIAAAPKPETKAKKAAAKAPAKRKAKAAPAEEVLVKDPDAGAEVTESSAAS
jgi:hypothetical protein